VFAAQFDGGCSSSNNHSSSSSSCSSSKAMWGQPWRRHVPWVQCATSRSDACCCGTCCQPYWCDCHSVLVGRQEAEAASVLRFCCVGCTWPEQQQYVMYILYVGGDWLAEESWQWDRGIGHGSSRGHTHVTVSQGFGGPRSSSSRICTCTCITNHFFPLTDTTASASAIFLQSRGQVDGGVHDHCESG
jgi:hypothetical protein